MYRFSAASQDESIVFGAARPGYRKPQVDRWINFMRTQRIQRVCCLITESQLSRYGNLLNVYRYTFGVDRVCWAPIEDFHLVAPNILINRILPFLTVAKQKQERVVVHCSGGIGRTGHVLAAWLVAERGFSSKAAIAAVRATGRNPYEAVVAAPFKGRSPCQIASELDMLLECIRVLEDE
ncbi:MAG: dual specificity protein phosphatase family protein [Cyanobacteria bacterium J06621_3]